MSEQPTQEKREKKYKEFGLSSWSVNNRKTVFLIALIVVLQGIGSYVSMPKEQFPELMIPEIYVGTPFPGGSPSYIEDKITQPFEKEINSIKNIDKITSTSINGYSSIRVAFDFSVSPEQAKRKVEDAVSEARAKPEFPDLPVEPNIFEMDVSDMPIMNVNLSGDYSVDRLKEYAEQLEDKIENLAEVSEVDIRGVQEKAVKIELRKMEAEAKNVTFNDISRAIQSENVTMPSGELEIGGTRRSIRVEGEFEQVEQIKNIIVKQEDGGNEVYMYEVADVSFGDEEITSYAREFKNPVVMLDIKKRSGENLLDAAAKIKTLLDEETGLPDNVYISITNDQSYKTLDQVSNLENSIIFGVILVVLVLLFFLGLRNALFVGIAIPLSMFLSFILLDLAGVTLNVMVLFSLVLALGMLVDNGIVVVENIYRLMDEGMDAFSAARKGVGEVAWPIIASTATTLAAFVPLAFWPGIMGEFMKYLPITLMTVLGSSLFVALVINPVFTAVYMKVEQSKPRKKVVFIVSTVALLLGTLAALGGAIAMGNFFFLVGGISLLNFFVFVPGTERFQNGFLPRLEKGYTGFLQNVLKGRRPGLVLGGTFGLLVLSFFLIGAFPPKIEFFPVNQPNYVNVFIEHPIGTDIEVTNETTREVEEILDREFISKHKGDYNVASKILPSGERVEDTVYIVQSMISQVGKGTSDPAQGPSFGNTPHKARVTISFAEFQHRNGIMTSDLKEEIDAALTNRFPADVRIIVDKNQDGPPQEPPVNIEVTGPTVVDAEDEYQLIVDKAEIIRNFLNKKNVPGSEELRLNIETGKPEVTLEIDRNKAIRFGLSTQNIAQTLRTALFGADISTFKKGEETYDINVRLDEGSRGNIESLLDQKITFRNNKGQLLSVPIRSVLSETKSRSTYGSVARKNLKKTVTVFANVAGGANPNEVVAAMKEQLETFKASDQGKEMLDAGYNYKFTGQQEEQAKEMAFLSTALGMAVFLILLIIVSQFNSYSTPTIILTAVVLSLIGVLLGLVIFRQDFIIIMTMIGIISLAGVVVNNAIVLIDYTNLIRRRKRKELGLGEFEQLPMEEVIKSIVEGGKTRLRPVLLTAITTVLGLFPLAFGININFVTLFTEYNANFFIGGDNVIFFGPMSWAIIYGLTFATFLTLVVVPVTYLLLYRLKLGLYRMFNAKLRSDI